MRRVLIATLAALIVALSAGGCAEGNPCTYPMMVGKVMIFFDKDDGTPVTYHDQPATCQDGEPVYE